MSGLDYKGAGVDLDAAERAKEGLKALVSSTRDANTLSELGSFGGLYAVPDDVEAPVLVSSADGAGTKLKLAFMTGVHDTVGQDLVNHCVDDILVQGAKPLFFLDYLACSELHESVVSDVVRGIAVACRENRCTLLGGETAQMPGFYSADEYDLAGFIVGVAPRASVLDGSRVAAGDALIALGSSGLHTNGYTLARKIVFERMGLGIDDVFGDGPSTVAEVLLTVHRSYLSSVYPLVEAGRINALSHITGGGLPGNLPRSLDGKGARLDTGTWEVPHVFRVLEEGGGVERTEMFRVFNMGIGMVVVAAAEDADALVRELREAGESAWTVGEVTEAGGVAIE